MATLKLKTAEERAAEIRAQSAEIEAANAAKAAEVDAKLVTKPVTVHDNAPKVDYKALAKAEEARAAELKAQADALQLELDPSLRPKLQTETQPYVKLTELLSRHDNAEDTLKALHDAIRQGRLEADKPRQETEWPSDLSHLTPQQRERTLREMAAGKAASERAQAAADIAKAARKRHESETAQKEIELAKLKEKLAEAEATIAVLRHNPTINEVFPTVDANKVTTSGATA